MWIANRNAGEITVVNLSKASGFEISPCDGKKYCLAAWFGKRSTVIKKFNTEAEAAKFLSALITQIESEEGRHND